MNQPISHAPSENYKKENKAPNLAAGVSSNILTNILQKETNIAIYERDINDLELEIQNISKYDIQFKSSGDKAHIANHLMNDLSKYELNVILADILTQLDLFAAVTKAKKFKILFATVNSNMCRRFHTDINSLRMLCTYFGLSTQWLSDDTTNSDLFQQQISNDEIEIDKNLINEVGTGNIAILKGALFPNGNPIMHRSPPIEKTGHKRLLLRIDMNNSLWA